MKISDLLFPDEYLVCEVDYRAEIGKLTTDTTELCEGDILIIPNAERMPDLSSVNAIPKAVVCGTNAILPDNFPVIRVSNPRLTMSKMFFRYENPHLEKTKIIGITGTNGKTSTATLICEALKNMGYKTGFIGTGKIEMDGKERSKKNYSMTTPDPALLYKELRHMTDAGCEAIVMEVSSHALALDKVAPIRFDYGVFTNLSTEHTDFHGSLDAYYKAKLKLFDQCKCGIFSIDDDYAREAYRSFGGRRISVGVIRRGDIWATGIDDLGFSGVSYLYHGADFSCKMKLKLPGIFNVYNSMLAAAVCIDMGCKPCDVKQAISKINSIPGRYEIIKDKITVIIDYAHTPDAFRSILRELSKQKNGGQLTTVFGCGGDRDKTKRPMMARIAERYADRIIITSDNSRSEDPKEIVADITRGFEKGNYEVKSDRREAIISAITTARVGDIVAILGKGAEKYNIDKSGYHDFDEKEIIRTALARLNECKR